MKLQNKTKRTYQHSYYDKNKKLVILNLYAGKTADVPDDIAKIWLKIEGITEYVDPAEAKRAAAEAAAKQAKLEEENEKLKAELEKSAAAKKTSKKQ